MNREKKTDLVFSAHKKGRNPKMTEAVASWKAYVSATAAGHGAYGKECEKLSACGMTEMVETHFVEATEVRSLLSHHTQN